MSKAKIDASGKTYTIEESADETEGVTIRDAETGETYEIVAFTDETVREYIESLSPGRTVRLELSPAGGSGPTTITGVLPTSVRRTLGAEYSVEACGV